MVSDDNPGICILKDSKITLARRLHVIKLLDQHDRKNRIYQYVFDELMGWEVMKSIGELSWKRSGRIIIGTQKLFFQSFFQRKNVHAKWLPKFHFLLSRLFKVGEFVPLDSEDNLSPYTENSFQLRFMAPGFQWIKGGCEVHYRPVGSRKRRIGKFSFGPLKSTKL